MTLVSDHRIPVKGRLRFPKHNSNVPVQRADGRWKGVPMNLLRVWTITLNMRRAQ